VPLGKYRGREIRIDVFQLAGSGRAPVEWAVLDIVDQPPGVFRIFEDDESFPAGLRPLEIAGAQDPAGGEGAGGGAGDRPAAADGAAPAAALVREGARSGSACFRVEAGRAAALADLSIAMSEWPRIGEYRFLRLSWRKAGEGKIFVEASIEGAGGAVKSRRYEAGGPASPGAVRIDGKVPEAWTDIAIDLGEGQGNFVLRGLAFGCPGGGAALFDRIYLVRAKEDAERIGEGPPGPPRK
jgi:hypothetical protein